MISNKKLISGAAFGFLAKRLELALVLFLLVSCSAHQKPADTPRPTASTGFSGDSAMQYLQAQCDLGPRVPGTEAHDGCVRFICTKLDAWGIPYDLQETTAKTYDGHQVPVRNITAHILPQATDRVLLLTHYDCRPWADNDPDSTNWHQPVMGANDAASGVAVLLELARQLSMSDSLQVGVDLLFDDVEDMGTPQFQGQDDASTWCLGTQAWANEQKQRGYTARYGILLDMVGDPSAVFPVEYFSYKKAQSVVSLVWNAAKDLGYADQFPFRFGGAVTDDHLPINDILGIPCIDLIHVDPETGLFPQTWHTTQDTPEHCSAQTLQHVGQVLLYVLK